MGAACSSSEKVVPHSDELMPDVLKTKFIPPIRHVSPTNPWLPLLTPHQLVEFDGAFRKFDRDGDGHIEPKELKHVMSNLGIPMSEDAVKKLIATVDTDGNGMIEFDEFIGIMAGRMMKEGGDEEINQAFNLFEQDEQGFVAVDMIKKVFMGLGSHRFTEEEADAMVAGLGPNAEGRVSFEEFRKAECFQVPLKEPPFAPLDPSKRQGSRTDAVGGSSGG